MADNTEDKKSSWLEDRFKQNLYSLAQVGNQGIDKSKEIKEDYKKFGKDAVQLPGQLAKNRADRDAILERELKTNNLTESQKEQLKNISNAGDAQKFVDVSSTGNKTGDYNAGQSIYDEQLKSGLKAGAEFGLNVAMLPVGGAVAGAGTKAGIKVGSSLFKGAAEKIGSKLPSLKKFSSVFKSEADIAEEAKIAEKARREAAREAKREEIRNNATRSKNSTFDSNAENAAKNEAMAAEAKAAEKESTKIKEDSVKKTEESTTNTKPEEVPSKPSLFDSFKKGAKTAIIPGIIAGDMYDSLTDDEKKELQDKAEKGIDMAKEGLGKAGEFAQEAINNPEGLLEKGKDLLQDGVDKAGDLASTAASMATGAYVGSDKNPFKRMAGGVIGGIGGLFTANRSSEAALSSMPSGGDTGTTGESHFGSDDMSGKSAVEILNKIYGVLSRIYDTTQKISKDTSQLVRGAASQDAAKDASSANLLARQNEGGGSASPIFGGGGEDSSESPNKKEESDKNKGLWDNIFSKFLPKKESIEKIKKNGTKKGIKSLATKATKAVEDKISPKKGLASRLAGAIIGGKKRKIATAAIMGAAGLFASKNLDEEFENQGIVDPNVKEAIKAKFMSESGGKGGGEGDWTKTSNARIREKMPQLKGMSDDQLDDLKAQGNEVFLDKAYEKYGGYKYRGRGLTQLTGKDNYAAADKALGLNGELVNNPDILSTDKDLDKKVSVWFYKRAGADKKKFDTQEEANEWAIQAAGGKKYAPGTALAEKELDRLNKFQQATKGSESETSVASASPIKKDSSTFKLNPETGVYEQHKGGDIVGTQLAREEEQENLKGVYTPSSNKGGPRSSYTPLEELTKQEKEIWQNDLSSNADTVKQHSIYKTKGSNKNDNSFEQKRKNIINDKNLSDEEITKRLADLDKEKNNLNFGVREENSLDTELWEIDNQKATLHEERDKLAQLSPRNEKDMNSQLNRLSDISTEINALNERRNNVTGSSETLANSENKNSGTIQQVSVQQKAPPIQQVPMAPLSPAGYGKSIPNVRNDDPTLKMLEEGNMWRTTTHAA